MSVRLDFPPACCLLDIGGLLPRQVCGSTAREIEALGIYYGNRDIALGECSRVTCVADDREELILSGATGWIMRAGYGMEAGTLIIDGDAGPLIGAEMGGGCLEVLGNASQGLGTGLRGGTLRVRGNAGDRCGAALPGREQGMTGGVIIVDGNVGKEAGAGMRRGLIVIGGEGGESTGANLLAGTILCFGRLGAGAGLGMQRGAIVAGKIGHLLPGFRAAGEADLEWLRIYLGWLRRLGTAYPLEWGRRSPARFTGDHLALGKGEVLGYDFSE